LGHPVCISLKQSCSDIFHVTVPKNSCNVPNTAAVIQSPSEWAQFIHLRVYFAILMSLNNKLINNKNNNQ